MQCIRSAHTHRNMILLLMSSGCAFSSVQLRIVRDILRHVPCKSLFLYDEAVKIEKAVFLNACRVRSARDKKKKLILMQWTKKD